MHAFTLIDGAALIVIAVSALLSHSRGLLREALSMASWVAAVILAFRAAPAIAPHLARVPVIGDLLTASCEFGVVSGFVIAMAVVQTAAVIPIAALARLVRGSIIGPIDRGLGLLLGIVRGLALVMLALLAYEQLPIRSELRAADDSVVHGLLARPVAHLATLSPADLGAWLGDRFVAMTRNCQGGGISDPAR